MSWSIRKPAKFPSGITLLFSAIIAAGVIGSGCARPKPMGRPDLETPLSLDVAVRMVSFDLFAQVSNKLQRKDKWVPAPFVARTMAQISEHNDAATKVVPVSFLADVIMNADTGEEIELSKQIHDIIKLTAENSFAEYSVAEMDSGSIDRANYVIIGVIKFENFKKRESKIPHLFLSAVDLKNGQVVAHSEVWLANQEMKLQPTPLYSDSPMFLKDTHTEKVIATAKAQSGTMVDNQYFSSMETNALLSEASAAYNGGNYALATELFAKVAKRDDGQILKTYAGLYQAFFKLNQLAEAEDAFAQLAGLGLKNGTLSVKFLFQVGDTSFFGQPEEIVEYDIWLRQIARKVAETDSCVEISGHASRTGSAEFNKRLSDKRAHTIQGRLADFSPVIGKKTVAVGRGFEQNIVGSGSDDIRDSIDRRVEFKVLDCNTL